MPGLIMELCQSLDKARRFISLVEMDASEEMKEAARAQLTQIAAALAKAEQEEGR